MTTNATLTNKPYLAPQMPEKTVISLIKTTLWLGAIILLPQLILAFGFSLFFGIQQGGDFSADAFNLWFRSIPVLLTMSLIAPIISLPLLMLASDKDASKNNWSNLFAFCALKPITLSALAKYLGLGLLFWLLSSFIGELLGLPIEQFMLDIKMANNSLVTLVLILSSICVVIPIMEELTFRGWLYSKIKLTKLGDAGALFMSALIFTLIHTQYNNPITLVFIFSLGLFLGFVRYKSNNINYTIAIHILFNSLAMAALFLFDI